MKTFARFATAKTIQRSLVRKQEALIAEAKDIIRQAEQAETDEHAQLVEKLGFVSSVEVRKRKEKEEEARKRMAAVKANEEVAMKYPGFRFVSKKVMEDVCKDYGLVLGGIDRYTGTVPKWAAKAIAESGIMKEAEVLMGRTLVRGEHYVHHVFNGEPNDAYYRHEFARNPHTFWIEKRMMPELLIAAPKKMMLLRAGEEVRGYQIVKRDPIVCFAVSGGYVVIAAWDEEGRDPRIINTQNN